MSTISRERIIALIRQKGPCLPTNINKELETNILFASAMLSELVSSKAIKITNLKRASSPYYYLEEQKEQLQNISHYLNDKDKLAYDLIKEKLVLKDETQTPLTRVTLRAIKDYAIPLHINYKGNTHVFWKWYLLDDEQAKEKIGVLLGIKKEIEKKEKPEPVSNQTELPKQKIIPVKEHKKPVEKKIKQETVKREEIKESISFLDQIKNYFNQNSITITSSELMNKRGTEIDLIIELPSSVGKLQYYCKAKSKKKINDSDIALALVQAQQKKLPCLVLITGEMTKKTKEMLKNEFKGIKVQRI